MINIDFAATLLLYLNGLIITTKNELSNDICQNFITEETYDKLRMNPKCALDVNSGDQVF